MLLTLLLLTMHLPVPPPPINGAVCSVQGITQDKVVAVARLKEPPLSYLVKVSADGWKGTYLKVKHPGSLKEALWLCGKWVEAVQRAVVKEAGRK